MTAGVWYKNVVLSLKFNVVVKQKVAAGRAT